MGDLSKKKTGAPEKYCSSYHISSEHLKDLKLNKGENWLIVKMQLAYSWGKEQMGVVPHFRDEGICHSSEDLRSGAVGKTQRPAAR